MRTLLIVAATAGLLASAAAAATPAAREPTAAPVPLTSVDFANPASVQAFYAKLRRTARDVCNSNISFDRATKREDAACMRKSLDRAVGQLNRPILTARHQARNETRYATGF